MTFGPRERQADFILRAVLDQQDEPGEGLRIDFGPLPPGVRKGTWGPYETVEFVDTDPAAATLSVSGTVLTVDYPRALDGGSTPSPRDFVVLMAVPGGEAAIPVTAVTVDGDVVSLALARPVRPDDMVPLSYLMDAMHPTRDAAGLPVAPLTDEPVRNVTGASDPQAEIQLPDGTALAGLTGLRELDLRNNAVTDLWPLAELTSLQVLLTWTGNQITDVQALSALANLGLAENQIANLWPLTGLDRLHRLDLSGNADRGRVGRSAYRVGAHAAEPGGQLLGHGPLAAGGADQPAGVPAGPQPDHRRAAALVVAGDAGTWRLADVARSRTTGR